MATKIDNQGRSVKGVQVCRTGMWNGISWSEADFDQAIDNFNNNLADIPLILTRGGEHGQQHIVMPGGGALGKVSELRREGDVLVADFKNVPPVVADLLKAGTFDQKSIEGWTSFMTADGEEHGRVIDGVLFFGVGLPAVHGLSDLIKLYETSAEPQPAGRFSCSSDTVKAASGGQTVANGPGTADDLPHIEPTPQGGSKVDKIELSNEEYKALIAASAREDAASKESVELRKKLETSDADKVKLQTERDDLKKKIAENEAERVRHQTEQLGASVDVLVKAGKLEPARKDAVIEHCSTLSIEDRAKYLKTAENLPVMFKETTPTGSPPPKKDDNGNPLDEVHAKAIALQKAAPGLSYDEAKKAAMAQMGG